MHTNHAGIDVRLPLVQDADLRDKIVLVRVDHNVVKNGVVRDPYRIDATIGTLYSIVERGGRLILMSHIGRPRDNRTTGTIGGATTASSGRPAGPVAPSSTGAGPPPESAT